jgi:hypothetical protein
MSDENRAAVEIVELCNDDDAQDVQDRQPAAAPPRGAALSVLWWPEADLDPSV